MKSILLLVALFGFAASQTGTNPFIGKTFYVNPSYQKELNSSIATATGTALTNLQKMYNVPSAYWLDVMAKINGSTSDTTTAPGILADAKAKGGQLVVLIV